MPDNETIEEFWEGLRPPREDKASIEEASIEETPIEGSSLEAEEGVHSTTRVQMLQDDLRALGFPCQAYMRGGALHLFIEVDQSTSRQRLERNVFYLHLFRPQNPQNRTPTPRA
jgi:hypothetical protein